MPITKRLIPTLRDIFYISKTETESQESLKNKSQTAFTTIIDTETNKSGDHSASEDISNTASTLNSKSTYITPSDTYFL